MANNLKMYVELGTNPPPPLISIRELLTQCSRQFTSIFPIFCILTSCASHYSWGITLAKFSYNDHFTMSWFIGAIIGSLVSSLLVQKIPTKIYCCTSGVLSIISNILFIALDNLDVFLVVRYISGFAFGLLFIPGVIYASEIADKRIRGTLSSILSLPLIFALLIGSIIYVATYKQELAYGIVSIVFAALGIGFSLWMLESPIYLLLTEQDSLALDNLRKLRNETTYPSEITAEIQDIRDMIAESKDESPLPFAAGNFRPLYKLMLLRTIYAFSMSMPMMIELTNRFSYIESGRFSLLILVLCRIIFECLNTVFIDRWGHFVLLNRSLLPSGLSLIIFVSVLEVAGYVATIKFIFVCILLYQIFSGCGLGTSSVTCLGQSFPISKKAYSIVTVFVLEMIVHIVTISLFSIDNYATGQFFGVGAASMILGVAFCFLLPDTTGLSLKESQQIMRDSQRF